MKHSLLNFVFLILAFSMTSSAEILFQEDFSGSLSDNWILFGDPSPILCDTFGLPPPSFDCNGDAMYNNGIVSIESWDMSEGLVLECDMFVTSNERGAWISGLIGLDYSTEDQGDEGTMPADINLSYCYCGEADWAQPHLQGTLYTSFNLPDGSNDNTSQCHINEYLDSWHQFRIVIEHDRRLSYYIDSTLVHQTELTLPPDIGALSVVLGVRSNEWGRVFHDNVVLRAL